jgi:hypothetical protein
VISRAPRAGDEVLRRVGIGDEAVVACRDSFGCWGLDQGVPRLQRSVVRSGGSRPTRKRRALACFSDRRRATDTTATGGRHNPPPPGLIVLDSELAPVSRTVGARAWIDGLPGAPLFHEWGILPAQVYPLATLARSGAPTGVHALERAVDGRWVTIEAALLNGGGDATIAVTLRAATPGETFGLLCRVYGLTAASATSSQRFSPDSALAQLPSGFSFLAIPSRII